MSETELIARADRWFKQFDDSMVVPQPEAEALIRDLLAALPPAQGWQPIETYPKNRAPWVLLWWPYWSSHPVVGRWEHSIGDWWSETKLEGATEGPQAWSPLPAPPVAAKETP